MQVETFEQTELVGENQEKDNSPEALELIEKLGLDGQKNITSEDGVRAPYRQMNVTELKVYQTLFPESCKIEEYKKSMIPVRVLQVALYARDLGIFEEICVWSEKTKPTDPVLVGVKKHANGYSEDFFILARWGEALESFDVLYEKAKTIIMEKYKSQCTDVIVRAEHCLKTLENEAKKHLCGDWNNIPS